MGCSNLVAACLWRASSRNAPALPTPRDERIPGLKPSAARGTKWASVAGTAKRGRSGAALSGGRKKKAVKKIKAEPRAPSDKIEIAEPAPKQPAKRARTSSTGSSDG